MLKKERGLKFKSLVKKVKPSQKGRETRRGKLEKLKKKFGI